MPMRIKKTTSKSVLKNHKWRQTGLKSSIGLRMVSHGKLSPTASFNRAVARSIATTKKKGNPIARYDIQRRQAYLEYPDGRKAYVE